MAKSRPQKTLADYVVIAIVPALIMVLVGSLVYFLLEVCYSGRFESRFRWILFWFVFASVLIARISIVQGSAYASAFGLALAVATGLVVLRFVGDAVIAAFCLLGVIWWSINKLTWDCTLIDDSEDASGEGLLQVAGMDDRDAAVEEQAAAHDDEVPLSDEQVPWWQRWFMNRSERQGQPHAPGLWVVYFSLAALPIFGVGQLFIPADDVDARNYGFRLLWLYVASGLGLLMLTSFLGLRRYLRQRRLQMPAAMAGTWIVVGASLAAAILLLCVLLPRPQSDYSVTNFVDKVAEAAQKASDYALLRDDAGEGEGDRSGKSDKNEDAEQDAQGQSGQAQNNGAAGKGEGKRSGKGQQQGGNDSKRGQRSGKNKQTQAGDQGNGSRKSKSSGKGKKSDQRKGSRQGNDSGRKKSDNGSDSKKRNGSKKQDDKGDERRQAAAEKPDEKTDQQSGAEQSSTETTPKSNMSKVGSWVGKLVKWIIYGLLAVAFVYVLIRNWPWFVNLVGRLLQELVNLWNSLFGRKREESGNEPDTTDTTVPTGPPPFAAFANPFQTGAAQRKSPAELVRYTFEALEAWAYENRLPRRAEQTPLEFAQALGAQEPAMAHEVNQVAQHYARLAYAGRTPRREHLDALERLWRKMSQPAFEPVSAATVDGV